MEFNERGGHVRGTGRLAFLKVTTTASSSSITTFTRKHVVKKNIYKSD